jgi:hypothetical protein
MDFNTIFQFNTKKFWWMDVVFYFVISLLISTIFCYAIFLVKNSLLKQDIEKQVEALQTVGTAQQKADEAEVINYKRKINDFTDLLQSHQFTSNVFAFMQQQTLPNVWFKQFSLSGKNATVQLTGEADDMDTISRQVAVFEKNKYVKSLGTLTSSVGTDARNSFNVNLVLNADIFDYLSVVPPAAVPAVVEPPVNPGDSGDGTPVEQPVVKSSEKMILSFHLLLNPEVVGALDQENHKITLDVPGGTDIKNLTPSIMVSAMAAFAPANTSQDFTNPVTYTVTAEDGSTQDYVASVVVSPASGESGQKGSAAFIILIVVSLIVVAVLVVVLLILRKRRSQKEII